jgi:hypothetical protein
MEPVITLYSLDILAEQRYSLPDDISAIELIPSAGDELSLGPILRIPGGAEVEYCGTGFDDQTVKIRWRGKCYFAFREDLQTRHKPPAMSACC